MSTNNENVAVELKGVRKLSQKQAEEILEADPTSPAVFDCLQLENPAQRWLDDKKFVLYAVGKNGMLLEDLEQYQDDLDICKAAVAQKEDAAQFVSNKLLADKDLRIAVLKKEGGRLQFAPPDSKNSEEECVIALTNSTLAFSSIDPKLHDNQSVMLAAIKHDHKYFNKASKRLKNDAEFMNQAVIINPNVLKIIVKTRENALKIVKANGLFLQYLNNWNGIDYTRDEEICLYAVHENHNAAQWIADKTLTNPLLCLAAVQLNGMRLKMAPQFQKEESICLAAIKQNATAYQFVDQSLKNRLSFVKKAVQANHKIFDQAVLGDSDVVKLMDFLSSSDPKEAWQNDKRFAIQIVKRDGLLLKHFPNFQKDVEVCSFAVLQNRGAVDLIDDSMLTEPVFALAAVQQDNKRFEKIPPKLKGDKTIALAALAKDDSMFSEIDPSLYSDDDIMLSAIKHNHNRFVKASDELKANKRFISQAINTNSQVVMHIQDDMAEVALQQKGILLQHLPNAQNDIRLCKLAVENDPKAIQFIGKVALEDLDLCYSAVIFNGLRLADAPEQYKKHMMICLEAIGQNAEALKYVDPELLFNKDFITGALKKNPAIKTSAHMIISPLLAEKIKKDPLYFDEAIKLAELYEIPSDRMAEMKKQLIKIGQDALIEQTIDPSRYPEISIELFSTVTDSQDQTQAEMIVKLLKKDPLFYSEYIKRYNKAFLEENKAYMVLYGKEFSDFNGEIVTDREELRDVIAISVNPQIYFSIFNHAKSDVSVQLNRAARLIFHLLEESYAVFPFKEQWKLRNALREKLIQLLDLKDDLSIPTLQEALAKKLTCLTTENLEKLLQSFDEELKKSNISCPKGYPYENYQHIELLYATYALAELASTTIPEHHYPKNLFENENAIKFIWDKNPDLFQALFDKSSCMKEPCFLEKALTEKTTRLRHLSETFKNRLSDNLYQRMWIKEPSLFQALPEKLRLNESFILDTLQKAPLSQREALFKEIGNEYKNNHAFLVKVLNSTPSLWSEIPQTIKSSEEFIMNCLRSKVRILEFLETKLLTPYLVKQILSKVEMAALNPNWAKPYLSTLTKKDKINFLLEIAETNPLFCDTPLFVDALESREGNIKYAAAKILISLLRFEKISRDDKQKSAIQAFRGMLETGQKMLPAHIDQFHKQALKIHLTTVFKQQAHKMNLTSLGENFVNNPDVEDIMYLFKSNRTAAKVMPNITWDVPIKTTKNRTQYMRKKISDSKSPAIVTVDWTADRRFALAEVKKNGMMLSIFKHFQDDAEICFEACHQNAKAAKFIGNSLLRTNGAMCILAVREDAKRLKDAGSVMQETEAVCVAALERSAEAFPFISYKMHDNANVMLAAIRHNHKLFEYTTTKLRQDHEFMKSAAHLVVSLTTCPSWAQEYMSQSQKDIKESLAESRNPPSPDHAPKTTLGGSG